MRKRIVVAVTALVALGVLANAGLMLVGARRQVDAFARAGAERAATGVARATSSAADSPAAPAPSPVTSVGRVAETREPLAADVDVRFDPDAALREAGDRDPNVAELMNDADPAVGDAVRDFITHLDAPGGN